MYDSISATHVRTPICLALLYGEGSHIPVKCRELQRKRCSKTPAWIIKPLAKRKGRRRERKMVYSLVLPIIE